MGYQVDLMERMDLVEIVEGNLIQFTGTVDGAVVTLGVDVFKKTDEHIYALGIDMRVDDAGERTVNEELTNRYYRLPLDGIIEPGNVAIDSLAAPQDSAPLPIEYPEELPEDSWAPLNIGCVALELFHHVQD